MRVMIREEDIIQSIADAIQFISYYHPADFIRHLTRAYEREEHAAARGAIAQILTNSRMCAEGKRPLCQDTGIVNIFMKVGMDVRFDALRNLQELCDEGVRRGYRNPDNLLRASIVEDPLFCRRNTGDNTPCVLNVELVTGGTVDVHVASMGGGAENKGRFAVLSPNESLVEWVLRTVQSLGAGWCPPGILGIGVGGTAEKTMLLAKQSLMDNLDMYELLQRGPDSKLEELRIELYEKVNALGIGAQGIGGLTTVLDIKIHTFPTHAASKPVAMIPNCAATRHVHFVLDGSRAVGLDPPSLSEWPAIQWAPDYTESTRVDINTLTKVQMAEWTSGQVLLLSGKLVTGRDAAHGRIRDMLARGEKLPVNFSDRIMYFVGPVDPVRDEVVGPAGPTTAMRMDEFTEMMLGQTGLLATIGKAERGPRAIEAIRKYSSAYLIAVGGAAYLVSKAIRSAKVLGFDDLGMEAIYEFDVKDMPVVVAVDARGTSIHDTGPKEWKGIRPYSR